MLQRLRENLWAFPFQIADSIVYTIGDKTLDGPGEKVSGDYDPCLNWPRPLPGSTRHTRPGTLSMPKA
jgi:hypothetical protein